MGMVGCLSGLGILGVSGGLCAAGTGWSEQGLGFKDGLVIGFDSVVDRRVGFDGAKAERNESGLVDLLCLSIRLSLHTLCFCCAFRGLAVV